MKYVVTGGAGFIGSHLVDALIAQKHEVTVIDNLRSGYREQVNPKASFIRADIATVCNLKAFSPDALFHLAAIARTPWCIEDPVLASEVNAHGTLCILEAARKSGVKRVVMASSNVCLAAMTPYRATKEMLEMWGKVYVDLYGQSVIWLRFSNVIGPRASELGPSPNVTAALRKCKKEKGYVEVTGDGTQSRGFAHVRDIVRGLIAASESKHCGMIDLCPSENHTLNEVAAFYNCPIRYVPDRPGDVAHIVQDPQAAHDILGWKAEVPFAEAMKDVV